MHPALGKERQRGAEEHGEEDLSQCAHRRLGLRPPWNERRKEDRDIPVIVPADGVESPPPPPHWLPQVDRSEKRDGGNWNRD